MILLARGLTRLATFVVLAVLAVGGAATAVGSVSSGSGTVSLPGLASLLSLDSVERETRSLLGQLEATGPTAVLTALVGGGAVLLGLVLLVGLFWPRRERLIVLASERDGILAVRRRAMGRMLTSLAQSVPAAEIRRARCRPARRGRPGGRTKVKARAVQPAETLKGEIVEAIAPLTSPFGLKQRVRLRGRDR